MHLYQDATQGPHVNGQVIGHSQQHLRRTVEATLDILVYLRKIKTIQLNFPTPLKSVITVQDGNIRRNGAQWGAFDSVLYCC